MTSTPEQKRARQLCIELERHNRLYYEQTEPEITEAKKEPDTAADQPESEGQGKQDPPA